jgi:3-hydroxyisobutyrate dehydrogenase-like beta-hydroxyacid dehydrogenase
MQVGFLGLGAMGTGMARNFIRAGHVVHAWNRSGNSSLEGARLVGSPADALQGDVVFTMLSDDAAIREVLLDSHALSRARAGLIHVVNSTISVAFAEELATLHAKSGLGYVAAPVLGRPDVAAKGELNVLAAGLPAAVDKVRPLLALLGKVWDLGADPKRANATKLAANMMLAMAIEAMAEAVAITETNGVSRDTFFDVILNTLFGARAYRTYSANIARDNYEPGFRARLGLKDLRLATAAAAGHRLPMLEAMRQQMSEVVEAGLGERDWSVVADFTLKQRS